MTRQDTQRWSFTAKTTLLIGLTAFGALAYWIGISGIATAPAGQVFRPIALTALIPVLAFVAIYLRSTRFRSFVLNQDIKWLTMLQSWRVIGFSFLLIYVLGDLPGFFAWPAALGDVAVGLAAPFVVARLERDPSFVHSFRFASYHALGLFDFAVAMVAAMLTSGTFPSITGSGVTSYAMEVWPLNLFPSFGVPIFIILHLVVFLKLRALRRGELEDTNALAEAA